MQRSRLSPLQLFNMSFGFLGIQFGWGLQLANMSAIYQRLGASADQVPILWLAAPMTGFIVQPIIGALSDRTWGRLGRRRPYFLTGAILASIGLFVMPTSSTLWMAATLLWILDASINISMEPFRAFVADKLPPSQRTQGFVLQSFMIGLGASIANALPLVLSKFGVAGNTASGIPLSVYYAFRIGAVVFLAAVLWTVFTTREDPPENLEAWKRERAASSGLGNLFGEIFTAIGEMPKTMWQLAIVQFITWLGLFCMWIFFVPATAFHVFGAPDAQSPLYTRGIEWGGYVFSYYSITCFIVALALPKLAAMTSRKIVHALALLCGSAGLFSVYVIHDPQLLIVSMIGVGVAWASILSMPYAMLSTAVPAQRMGVYMGVFNFFIVLPEILFASLFGSLIRWKFGANSTTAPLYIVMVGATCLAIAAVAVSIVDDVGGRATAEELLKGDAHEPLTVQESMQPVPSGGQTG